MHSSWNAGRRAVRTPSGMVRTEEEITLGAVISVLCPDDRTKPRPDYPSEWTDDDEDDAAKKRQIDLALHQAAERRHHIARALGKPSDLRYLTKADMDEEFGQKPEPVRRVRRNTCAMCEDEGCWNCQ